MPANRSRSVVNNRQHAELCDDGEGADAKPVAVVRALGGEVATREKQLTGNVGIAGDGGSIVGFTTACNTGKIPATTAGTRHAEALPTIGGGGGGSVRTARTLQVEV